MKLNVNIILAASFITAAFLLGNCSKSAEDIQKEQTLQETQQFEKLVERSKTVIAPSHSLSADDLLDFARQWHKFAQKAKAKNHIDHAWVDYITLVRMAVFAKQQEKRDKLPLPVKESIEAANFSFESASICRQAIFRNWIMDIMNSEVESGFVEKQEYKNYLEKTIGWWMARSDKELSDWTEDCSRLTDIMIKMPMDMKRSFYPRFSVIFARHAQATGETASGLDLLIRTRRKIRNNPEWEKYRDLISPVIAKMAEEAGDLSTMQPKEQTDQSSGSSE